MFLLFAVLSFKIVSTCFPTRNVVNPTPTMSVSTVTFSSISPITITGTGPTTTISVPAGCCQPLSQSLTMTEFPDGLLTFTYNSEACRTMVVANCSQTDPAFDLAAALFANRNTFLDYADRFVTFPGTCNSTNQRWYMGNPPLLIDTLECILTNPPAAGRRKR